MRGALLSKSYHNRKQVENIVSLFCFFSRELSGMSAALCLVTVAWRHHNNESLKMFDQNRLDDSSRCSPTPWMTHCIRAGKRELECKSIISSFNCLVPYISFNICSREPCHTPSYLNFKCNSAIPH